MDKISEQVFEKWGGALRKMAEGPPCTPECWAMPECDVCGMRKKPRGRDAGIAAANGYCGEDCEGYNQEPRAGHLWPGEEATRK